ncbi:hypothetical protein D3C77_48790 [compost metagenome]
MTDPKFTGGAAFGEFKQCGDVSVKSGGLTVRDYFAAKVLQGLVSNTESMGAASDEHDQLGPGSVSFERYLAGAAYELADAMLEERAK